MKPREICERYEKLYTGAVADILDEKGFRRQCLGKELRPLLPERRAAGFAFPALGEACANVSYDCRPEILKFLGAVPADSMVVFVPRSTIDASRSRASRWTNSSTPASTMP